MSEIIPTINIAEAALLKLFKQYNIAEIDLTAEEIENLLDEKRLVMHSIPDKPIPIKFPLEAPPSTIFKYKVTLQEV